MHSEPSSVGPATLSVSGKVLGHAIFCHESARVVATVRARIQRCSRLFDEWITGRRSVRSRLPRSGKEKAQSEHCDKRHAKMNRHH